MPDLTIDDAERLRVENYNLRQEMARMKRGHDAKIAELNRE